MADDLGMIVYAIDPYLPPDFHKQISPAINRSTQFEQMLPLCDYISLHLPSNDETRGMFNAKTLESAKKGLKFLNFARADLVIPFKKCFTSLESILMEN